jgi:hypothetical protein
MERPILPHRCTLPWRREAPGLTPHEVRRIVPGLIG